MGGMACGSTMINIVCSADRYQHSNTRSHSDWGDDVSFIHVVFLLPSSPYIIQSTSTSTVFSLYSYSLHFDSQRPPSFTRTCTRKSKQSTTTSIHAHCSTSLAPPDHVVPSPCTAHTQQQQFSKWTPYRWAPLFLYKADTGRNVSATPCRPLPFLWNPLSRGSVFPT